MLDHAISKMGLLIDLPGIVKGLGVVICKTHTTVPRRALWADLI
jgi:hypothetical protein